MYFVGGAADRQRVERFDRRFCLALRGAEGREIVLRRPLMPARRASSPRRRARARHARNAVTSAPAPAAARRVKCGRGSGGAVAEKRAWKSGAATAASSTATLERARTKWLSASRIVSACEKSFCEIEMRHLRQGVHAGIGAPGAMHS